ncbi:TldD/PmbA family protein [Fusibacter sp. JL298sf-3]
MYNFPEGLYTDVRIEETATTKISFKNLELEEEKIRQNKGAFIRVFDGTKWYYAALTDLDAIQAEIDALAQMAAPNADILNHPIVKAFEVHQEVCIQYEDKSVAKVSSEDKTALLKSYIEAIGDETILNHKSYYVDTKIKKTLYTSKGSDITFDKQTCGFRIGLDMASGGNKEQMGLSRAGIFFDDLKGLASDVQGEILKCIDFVKNAKPVKPGVYPVLMSPEAAGVFTHESFGHKSESDFMVGDETMKREWALGKKVGADILSIIDDGTVLGNGYVPYDDEGTKGRKNYIITDGKLTGRLHSTATSAVLEEGLTGNARAMNFEFEPIVRMTTTYIEKGTRPLKDIVAEIDYGIYIDTINHGSGMSTFTIAPSRAYEIIDGEIKNPVKVSVVTGNVFETLGEVDAVSEEFMLHSFVGGGCGKMEQWPLPVGFGGPYTRVKKLNVQ